MALLTGDLQAIVGEAIEGADLSYDIPARTIETFQVRSAAQALAGASSIGFNALLEGLTGTQIGDTFTIGATTHTVSKAVSASGGTVLGVTFSPALAAAIPAQSQIALRRETARTFRGFGQQVDVRNIRSALVQAGDWQFLILGRSVPSGVRLAPNDLLRTRGGQWLKVFSVSGDPAEATFTALARQA